jgi:hypothetical protein
MHEHVIAAATAILLGMAITSAGTLWGKGKWSAMAGTRQRGRTI